MPRYPGWLLPQAPEKRAVPAHMVRRHLMPREEEDRPYVIDGVIFYTLKDAARHFCVRPGTMRKWMRLGKIDFQRL